MPTTTSATSTPTGREAMARIAREGVLISGGARAVLLQVAHPGVGRGVAEHSNFAERPLDRLRTTLTYLYAVSLGTPEEAARVSRIVNAVHRRVRGADYSADDADLQLWVAATLYDTAITIYERLRGPLPPDVAEDTYQQYASLATSLRVPPGMWPANRAAFAEYWTHLIDTVEVTGYARDVARDLLYPTKPPLALRAGMPLNRFLTTAWLPSRLRAEYGLSWDARRQRRYELLMDIGACIYPLIPQVLRYAPSSYYLRDMRRRLAVHTAVIRSH